MKNIRKLMLRKLLDQILSGNYDSSSIPLEKLFNLYTSSRQEYQSPVQRDTFNYGYMTSGEIGAGNQENT